MQSDDEGQQLTSVMEMCQVIVTKSVLFSVFFFLIHADLFLVIFN